jgi:tetratricopeptide (TPR) repeat protein
MSNSQAPGDTGQQDNDKAKSGQSDSGSSGKMPTGSLSQLVPRQKAATGEIKQPMAPAPGVPPVQNASQALPDQLQADLQAHENAAKVPAQDRRLAARSTGELMRPTTSRYANECEKIVQSNVRQPTVTDRRKPTAEMSPQMLQRARQFAAWRALGLFMVAMVLLLVCVLASRQAAVQMQAKQLFVVARNFLKDKKYDLAAEHFTQSLKKAPENSEVYFQRGMAYAHSEHFSQALSDYDKVLTMTPNRVAALNGKSFANLKQKNYDSSIAIATNALAHDPLDRNALLLRGIAYSKQGKLNEALADCNKLIESKPKGGLGPAYGNRAFVYFKLGQPYASIRDYRHAIEHAPKNAALYANLAQCLKRVNDVPGAIDECKNALRLDPKDLPSLMLAGECYRQTGEPKEAVKYFNRAVQVAPCPETLGARADAAMDAGDFKLAYNSLNQILESNPKDAEAKRKRQICHAAVIKSQGTAAAKSLEQREASASAEPIKLGRTFPELLHQGYTLLQAGSPSTAVQALSMAVRIEPRHAMSRRYLAYALSQSGNYPAASQQFAILGRLQKLEVHDLLVYSKALLVTKSYPDSIKVCLILLNTDPSHFEGRKTLSQAYLEMGQFSLATTVANDGIRYAKSESEKEAYRAILSTAQRGAGRAE